MVTEDKTKEVGRCRTLASTCVPGAGRQVEGLSVKMERERKKLQQKEQEAKALVEVTARFGHFSIATYRAARVVGCEEGWQCCCEAGAEVSGILAQLERGR